jgi:hypothetical protein
MIAGTQFSLPNTDLAGMCLKEGFFLLATTGIIQGMAGILDLSGYQEYLVKG